MFEGMKTMEKIQLDAIVRCVDVIKKLVKNDESSERSEVLPRRSD